ncbi:MAG: PilZ domain-containing protein [Chlamydiota bacterium]
MSVAYDAGRRQSKRARCVLKAVYRAPGHRSRLTETRDLSDRGLLILVSGEVKRGDLLELKIPLDAGERPLKARGRVVHIRKALDAEGAGNLAGVEFLELSEKHREAIGKRIWRQILSECTRFGKSR